MVIRPLYTSGPTHGRFNVDPSATFEAGQVGQLRLDAASGNGVVGLATTKPLGLIDDNKTAAFTQPIVGEVHAVMTAAGATWLTNNANLVSGSDLAFLLSSTGAVTATLAKPTDYTATSYTNGLFTVTAGGAIATDAPYLDTNGDGVADSVNVAIQYMFAVPGVSGVDSTLGSGLVTLHVFRGEFAISVYDTATTYAYSDKLAVGDGTAGKAPLGTVTVLAGARTGNTQCIGACVQPPTSSNPMLTLITDFDYGSWS